MTFIIADVGFWVVAGDSSPVLAAALSPAVSDKDIGVSLVTGTTGGTR